MQITLEMENTKNNSIPLASNLLWLSSYKSAVKQFNTNY